MHALREAIQLPARWSSCMILYSNHNWWGCREYTRPRAHGLLHLQPGCDRPDLEVGCGGSYHFGYLWDHDDQLQILELSQLGDPFRS